MSQNGESAGKPRKAHRVDDEWRQHVFLPGGDAACQAEVGELAEVPTDERLVACGGCMWAIGALRAMAETMVRECELPTVSPSKALAELGASKFASGTGALSPDVLAKWGRGYLWNALI